MASRKMASDSSRLEGKMGKTGFEARLMARRQKELEDARDKMFVLVKNYADLLGNKRLSKNKTVNEKSHQESLLKTLPELAAELDLRNRNEGTHTLLAMCLNSIIVLRDDNNNLRSQNFILNKKMEELLNSEGKDD